MTVPVCVRNNNPLNLRPGIPYEGLDVPASRDGFANFASPVWGFRAVFRNYITKFDRGVNTIKKLITEWAPPADGNDTNGYINAVCRMSGFDPDDVIALKTWDVASKICYAQAVIESGQAFEKNWTMKQMAEGAFRAGIVDAPTPAIKAVVNRVAAGASAVAGVAAAVQPAVQAASQQSLGAPKLQIALVILAIVLAAVAAMWSHHKHEES